MKRKRCASSARGMWGGLVLGLALALQVGVARADVVVRNASEGDDAFMARVLGPKSGDLAQKVVRSTEIAGGKLTLIGFVNADDNNLVGHLLIETSPGHYDHVTFPSCEEEGGAPELMAVFFARTVNGGGRNLAVLCSWEQGGPVTNGMFYGAQFYRLEEKGTQLGVEPVADLNKKFKTSDLVYNEHGKWRQGPKARFRTVAEVKKLLTKMGLKQ